MKTAVPHYQTDYYKGILGIYNRRIMRKFIRMGELEKEKGLILDFGCGVGHLKRTLSNGNVVGYDINTYLSDIDDYTKLKPSKIVAAASLQYLNRKQLEDFVNFCSSSKAELITVIPTENILAKLAMVAFLKLYAHQDHLTKYRFINSVIEKHYSIAKRKYLWAGMVQITRYKNKSLSQAY